MSIAGMKPTSPDYNICFSPVAGIKCVDRPTNRTIAPDFVCFSPVAGIKCVDRKVIFGGSMFWLAFQSRCRD